MNVSAELIETEGKVLTLASDRIRMREMAMVTVGDWAQKGTGLGVGEGTAGSEGANMARNRINRVLQVLKAAEISLTDEDGCPGTDALEMAMTLGGSAVGLELSTMQVPRARVGINGEPQKAMQDKHHAHQQEQVKEWDEIDRIVMKLSKENRQVHGKLSLDIKEDVEPTRVDGEIGSKGSTEEHG